MSVNRSKPDQYQLRFPPGLRDQIRGDAEARGRSMNAEILARLEEYPKLIILQPQISYLKMENQQLKAALEEQKKIAAQLQELIAMSAEDARQGQSTEEIIADKFGELKAQATYLEGLKAELLDLARQRVDLDQDKEKLIEDQGKVIDQLTNALGEGRSLVQRLLEVIREAGLTTSAPSGKD